MMLDQILSFLAKLSHDIHKEINELDAQKSEAFDQFKSFQNPPSPKGKPSKVLNKKQRRRNSVGQSAYL